MSKVIICLTACTLVVLAVCQGSETGLATDRWPGSAEMTREMSDTVRQMPDTMLSDTGRKVLVTTDARGQHRQRVRRGTDSTVQVPDSTQTTAMPGQSSDSAQQTDNAGPVKDSSAASGLTLTTTPATAAASNDPAFKPIDTTNRPGVKTVTKDGVTVTVADMGDTASQAKTPENKASSDSASNAAAASSGSSSSLDGGRREVDKRWFISPALKFQFQDFGMLEKNRKGYLSDANTLPFQKRGNGSFAASAYKNITGRLAISADIGLSFGHVTNEDVLISQTKGKTYNLLNAAVYYHLLSAAYRLQPYVTVGINDLINDKSYLTAPIGVGAKFNARRIMVLGQISYGYGVSKSTASTTMYSLGIYLPIKSKKQKKEESEDESQNGKKKKDDDKKKDSASRNNINIYVTVNVDSVLKAKGLLNDDGSGGGRRKGGNDDGDDDGSGSGSNGSGRRKGTNLRKSLNLDEDFGKDDFKVDTIDGVPVIRFVVYFEFNEYGLNSKAFSSIDRVVGRLSGKTDLAIVIKGYTDDVGDDHYNNLLSRKRAKMVLDYLNSRGVPSELMQAKAYGKDNPVADNSDPNQAWLNRRAEIIVREK